MAQHEEVVRTRASGFTLIEVLVAIGVVLVLIAIVLPSLRGARVSAGQTVMLSNLRGIGATFEVYVQTYQGAFPFHSRDKWYQMSPPDEPGVVVGTGDPWAMMLNWPSVFHGVAPWREHYRSWLNDGREVDESRPWLGDASRGQSGLVSYAYSCSFVARPEAWNGTSEGFKDDDELLQPTRSAEVSFPSAKALCVDVDRAYLRRMPRGDDRRGVLLADGSASARLDAGAVPPVQNRVNDRPARAYFDTPQGIRGRDIR